MIQFENSGFGIDIAVRLTFAPFFFRFGIVTHFVTKIQQKMHKRIRFLTKCMNFGTKCRYSFGNSDVIMNKMKTMKVMQERRSLWKTRSSIRRTRRQHRR